jgi:toxin ParE1/3/4
VKSLRLSPKAVDDLDGIWLHIARDNMAAADAVIDHLTDRFRTLCATPLMGPACPELVPGLRRLPTWNYVIFYSVRDELLVVERVLHAARDLPDLLREG